MYFVYVLSHNDRIYTYKIKYGLGKSGLNSRVIDCDSGFIQVPSFLLHSDINWLQKASNMLLISNLRELKKSSELDMRLFH